MLRRVGLLRVLGLMALAAVLAGCGFHLRSQLDFAFKTLAITPEKNGIAVALTRYLGSTVVPLTPAAGQAAPEAVLDIIEEKREKIVVGVNASGQVREYELRLRVNFRLRSSQGEELIPASSIEQHRSISFNESAVLAKESEEALLYRDMQTDVVQQLLRRLAAFKPAASATP